MIGDLKLTDKQLEARELAKGPAKYILFRGGSRSGKSFALCSFILERALVTPKSRHAIFRKTATDCRRTLFDLTFKDVMDAVSPKLWHQLKQQRKINDTEMTIELPNGSIILFDGLDDSTRIQRVLGNEYSTIFVNEVTEFATFDVFQTLMTRLSLELPTQSGAPLVPKIFLDCNPTSKRHWTYHAFSNENGKTRLNPLSGDPHPRQWQWAEIQMNPVDNKDHISSSYLEDLENLSARDRRRFVDGEWQADNDNAIFSPSWIKRELARAPNDLDDFTRIVVAIDPAGSSKAGADETGIIVAAIDDQNHIYILEDLSGRYRPDQWGRKAIEAYNRWQADTIIAEKNFGGEMVENTIRMLDSTVAFKAVNASRGKVIRAEPVASLYERGLVHHCQTSKVFEKLEGQLEDFTIDFDRRRNGSPDRLDALVWAVTELAITPQKASGAHSRLVPNFWR